jgi:hypothetical protein
MLQELLFSPSHNARSSGLQEAADNDEVIHKYRATMKKLFSRKDRIAQRRAEFEQYYDPAQIQKYYNQEQVYPSTDLPTRSRDQTSAPPLTSDIETDLALLRTVADQHGLEEDARTAEKCFPKEPSSVYDKYGQQGHHDVVVSLCQDGKIRISGRHRWARWYKQDFDRLSNLCGNCRHIDFEYVFYRAKEDTTTDPEDFIRLGSMAKIATKTSCPFCVLVANAIATRLTRDEKGTIIVNPESSRLLTAEWYLTPFTYSHYQYGKGFQLFLFPNIRGEDNDPVGANDIRQFRPDWPFAVRVLNGSQRGGRRISAHQLDFGWIRSTFQLCDYSSRPFPRLFQHRVRVVDVRDMCVVDLPRDEDYVVLSYCWGRTKMLTLKKDNEPALRASGSLISSSLVPQTIRDAIVLVRNVDQRYLWVDCEQDPSIQLKMEGVEITFYRVDLTRHTVLTLY